MFEILEREEMAQGTVVMNVIRAPKIAAKARPGQFVILRANETGERIPLTMADTDPEQGTITIIYQVVGKSTALFKTLQVGRALPMCSGPSGSRPISKSRRALSSASAAARARPLCIPLPEALKMRATGSLPSSAPAPKTCSLWKIKWPRLQELKVCTDDGSYGHHGFVSDILKAVSSTAARKSRRSWPQAPCP